MQLATPHTHWRSRGELEAIQEELLREHLGYCQKSSPYYRQALAGISPQTITLESLAQLPLTDKATFALHHAEFLAVPMEKVVDIVLTTGTTGKATSVFYTEHDLQRLALNETLSFAACGVSAADIALLTCTLDRCFVAGMAYQIGLRQLGAAVIRNGASPLASHMEILREIKPTLLVGVPTFLKKLAHHLAENGINPVSTSVRKLVCIGEPLKDAGMDPLKLASELEVLWNAPAYSTYASTEGVSSFCECTAQQGGHLHPELAIVEIVDEVGRRLPAGAHGEVVLTPLQTEGMPLVRFKTGDISYLIDEPCACGRITPRLGPILSRKNQMIKIKGTTVYPLSIMDALNSAHEVLDYYIRLSSEDHLSDKVTIHVALAKNANRQNLADHLQARLRVKTDIVIESEAAITQQVFRTNLRKATRIIDQRMKP